MKRMKWFAIDVTFMGFGIAFERLGMESLCTDLSNVGCDFNHVMLF